MFLVSGVTDSLIKQTRSGNSSASKSLSSAVWNGLFGGNASAVAGGSNPDSRGWIVPTPEQRAEQLLSSVSTVCAAVQSVSLLLMAAPQEDPSGAVAQSVGEVLVAFLSLSLAIDEYTSPGPLSPVLVAGALGGGSGGSGAAASYAHYISRHSASGGGGGGGGGGGSAHTISAGPSSRSHQQHLAGQTVLRPAILQLSYSLDNAIYRIVSRYYAQLAMFVLPPAQARRLQTFVDFAK